MRTVSYMRNHKGEKNTIKIHTIIDLTIEYNLQNQAKRFLHKTQDEKLVVTTNVYTKYI